LSSLIVKASLTRLAFGFPGNVARVFGRSSKIQRMKKLMLLSTLVCFLTAGCGASNPAATPYSSPTPSPVTSLTPSLPEPSQQPTLTVTPIFIDGTLAIKVNVRSGPGTTYNSLGLLEAGGKVKIITRDSVGAWFQILYPASPQGRGWVAAQYITLPPGVVVPLDATPTPAGPSGRVIQRLNVRNGPGTTFETLGVLEPGVTVSLTGKNITSSWFQIDYLAGSGGHGWVTSQYVQTDASSDLPVLDNFGNVVTPAAAVGTSPGPEMTPSPTVGPATTDGDSLGNPGVRVAFSAIGTRRFIYSSGVSAPQGDAEDWVEFTPFSATGTNARLIFDLTCHGNATLAVDLWQGGVRLSNWGTLGCGDAGKTILLPAGQSYIFQLSPVAGNGLQLVAYSLAIQNLP
jgi:uncharacterized protein YraI